MQENQDDEFCLLSNDEIMHGLERRRSAVVAGDRYALFEALAVVARYQAVMPDWLADQILHIEHDIETGQQVDFNKRFGWKPDRSNARYNHHMRQQLTSQIVAALLRRRIEGASFDRGVENSVFDAVGREIGVPRTVVIKVYKNNTWLKGIKQGNPENINFAFGDIVIPRGRRRGRPIL